VEEKQSAQPDQSEVKTKEEKPTSSGGKSSAGLIIVIILLVLVVLGVGGFFVYRYMLKKIAEQFTNLTPTATVTTTVTATPLSSTPMPTTTPLNTAEYVISDSNSRLIDRSELIGLTPWQLKVARNEIYARHGRPFVHKDMQCYFAKKSWYTQVDSFNESMLSAVENKNVATIQAYEREIDSPLASHDSGCNTYQ